MAISLTSSFQRNEALSFTDSFNKLSEWPQIQSTATTTQDRRRRDLQMNLESKSIGQYRTKYHKLGRQGAVAKSSSEPLIQTQHIKRYADLGTMKQRLSFLKAKIKESTAAGVESTALLDEGQEQQVGHDDVAASATPYDPMAAASSDRRESSSNIPEVFLKHAEKILRDVDNAIRAGTGGGGPNLVSEQRVLPPANTTPTPLPWSARSGPAAECDPEIALLLQGLPEAYEGDEQGLEDCLSDEAVRAALRRGGPPPAQLRLPHFYANSQEIMERLLRVRSLAVRVTHISIFSGRYGLRRSGSYLMLRPPANNGDCDEQVMLPLPELERPATLTRSAARQRQGLQRDDFFVGSQSLQQRVRATTFPVRVTDAMVWQWLRAAEQRSGDGLLRLDLFGHLTPRSSRAVCFGSAQIPLACLLSSSSLDTLVVADIIAEENTLAAVCERWRALPSPSPHHVHPEPLGRRMGSVQVRLQLLAEGADTDTVTDSGGALDLPPPPSFGVVASAFAAPPPRVQEEEEDGGGGGGGAGLGEQQRSAAMGFLPQGAAAWQPGPPERLGGFCGVSLFHVSNLKLPDGGGGDGVRSPCLLVLCCRTASGPGPCPEPTRLKVEILGPALRDGAVGLLSLEERHVIWKVEDVRTWRPPVFELWLESAAEKKLLGLARFNSAGHHFGEPQCLRVCDPASGKSRGRVTVAVHLHAQRAALVEDMQRCRGRTWFDGAGDEGGGGGGGGRVRAVQGGRRKGRGRGRVADPPQEQEEDDDGDGGGAVSDDSLDGRADLTRPDEAHDTETTEHRSGQAGAGAGDSAVPPSPDRDRDRDREVNILYVSLDGGCATLTPFPTLGCAVTYRLPAALSQCDGPGSEQQAEVLWWDALSPALNSSRRHLFRCPNPNPNLTQQQQQQDWTFAVYPTDDPDLHTGRPGSGREGEEGVPSGPVATATLTYAMWQPLLLPTGRPDPAPAELVLTAPLRLTDRNPLALLLPDTLSVRLTRRLEPVLLGKTGLGHLELRPGSPQPQEKQTEEEDCANLTQIKGGSVDLTSTALNDSVDLTSTALNDNVDLTSTTLNNSVDLTSTALNDSVDLTSTALNDSSVDLTRNLNHLSLAAVDLTDNDTPPQIGSVDLTFLQLQCAGSRLWLADGLFYFAAALLDQDDDRQPSPPFFFGQPLSAASRLHSRPDPHPDLMGSRPDLELHMDTVRIPIVGRRRERTGEPDLMSGDPDLVQALRGSWVVLSLYVRKRVHFRPLSLVFRNRGAGEPNPEGPLQEGCRPNSIQLADHYVGSAVVDLTQPRAGAEWFHLVDGLQRSVGQVRVAVALLSSTQDISIGPGPGPVGSVVGREEGDHHGRKEQEQEQEQDEGQGEDEGGGDDFALLRRTVEQLDRVRATLLAFRSQPSCPEQQQQEGTATTATATATAAKDRGPGPGPSPGPDDGDEGFDDGVGGGAAAAADRIGHRRVLVDNAHRSEPFRDFPRPDCHHDPDLPDHEPPTAAAAAAAAEEGEAAAAGGHGQEEEEKEVREGEGEGEGDHGLSGTCTVKQQQDDEDADVDVDGGGDEVQVQLLGPDLLLPGWPSPLSSSSSALSLSPPRSSSLCSSIEGQQQQQEGEGESELSSLLSSSSCCWERLCFSPAANPAAGTGAVAVAVAVAVARSDQTTQTDQRDDSRPGPGPVPEDLRGHRDGIDGDDPEMEAGMANPTQEEQEQEDEEEEEEEEEEGGGGGGGGGVIGTGVDGDPDPDPDHYEDDDDFEEEEVLPDHHHHHHHHHGSREEGGLLERLLVGEVGQQQQQPAIPDRPGFDEDGFHATAACAPMINAASSPMSNAASAPMSNATSAPMSNAESAPMSNAVSAPMSNAASAPMSNAARAAAALDRLLDEQLRRESSCEERRRGPSDGPHLHQHPRRHPGQQKMFVDAETERVSNIMMGMFNRTPPVRR